MASSELTDVCFPLYYYYYRKLVNLLVDVEEWGQVTLLNMLTRYARTQFIDPNQGLEYSEQVGYRFQPGTRVFGTGRI